jgi:hypothetical protein
LFANKNYKLDHFHTQILEIVEDIGNKEEELVNYYVNKIVENSEEKKNLFDLLSLIKLLKDNYEKFTSPNHFLEIKGLYIIPRANHAINLLSKQFPVDENLVDLLNTYAVTINILMDSIESDLARIWNKKNLDLHRKLDVFMKPNQQMLSLSQKVILMINSLPEVSCTLVGMRNQSYVKDVLSSVKNNYVKGKYGFGEMEKE